MRSFQLLTASLAALFTLTAALPSQKRQEGLGVKITNAEATNIIPNSYIVVYNSTFSKEDINTFQASVAGQIKKRNLKARHISGKRSLSTEIKTVEMGAWRCMALEADDAMINSIADSPQVAYVEADTIVQASALVQQTNPAPPLGLVRLSHAAVGGQGYIFDDTAGEGITVYVVDTGVKTTHTEFAGRATMGANFVDNVNDDGNGHGSHVSGTVGGTNFGVAKKAKIVGVKVLGADGSGANSGVLSGIDFVAKDAKGKKAVMNMSLGGARSNALNAAIDEMSKGGVVAVVAAGNENQDTANTSPGSAASAITVGAIDAKSDAKASFSNFGPDVDIHAPGVQVLSVGITSNTATDVLSGTSMASPHVAGLAAVLMAQFPELTDAASVKAKMLEFAALTGASVTGLNQARNGNTTTAIAYNGSGQ